MSQIRGKGRARQWLLLILTRGVKNPTSEPGVDDDLYIRAIGADEASLPQHDQTFRISESDRLSKTNSYTKLRTASMFSGRGNPNFLRSSLSDLAERAHSDSFELNLNSSNWRRHNKLSSGLGYIYELPKIQQHLEVILSATHQRSPTKFPVRQPCGRSHVTCRRTF